MRKKHHTLSDSNHSVVTVLFFFQTSYLLINVYFVGACDCIDALGRHEAARTSYIIS